MKISYYAFEIRYPCEDAGCTHVSEITKSLSKDNQVQIFTAPSGKDIWNPFVWAHNSTNYVRFTLWPKIYLIPFIPMNLVSWKIVYEKTKKFHNEVITNQNENRSHNSKNKSDVIHERFHSPNPFGWTIAKKLGIPHILEVNSPYVEDEFTKSRILKPLIVKDRKSQFENSDAIITQTETLKSIISHVSDTPIYVVSNGVDTKKFSPFKDTYLKSALGLKDDDIIITFSGSFRKWHGTHLLPQISESIVSEYPNVYFMTLGGSDPKIKHNIHPPVSYRTLPEFLNISDIMIMPFSSEGFPYFDKYGFWWSPLKAFEGMSMGKPIVSTNYPELRNIIREGGLLSEPNNIDQIISNLEYLIDHESERIRMGERGRRIALKEYDWNKRAEETRQIYNKVL